MSEDSIKNYSICSPYNNATYATTYARVAFASAGSAIVTLVACCLVIFTMILFKKWKFFSQRLILYLTIAGILSSIANILHRVDFDLHRTAAISRFCAFGGFLEQVTSWIFLNANSTITFYLFANVVLKKSTERLEVLYVLFIFLFPLTFNWIPFTQRAYGQAGAWCWIRSDDFNCNPFEFGQWSIFTLWFIPLYSILLILVVMYLVILCTLHRMSREWTKDPTLEAREMRNKVKYDIIPLMAYPCIKIILSIPALINRVQNFVSPNNPVLALWYMSALAFPLQGGLIAIAYALDPDTRKRLNWVSIREAFRECAGRNKKTEYPVEYPVETVDESLSLTSSHKYSKYVEVTNTGEQS